MDIPGYKPLREIARGPINTVLIYRQESLERDVLMKILHPQFASDPEIVERFKREAKVYAKLKHSNIVNVIDFGQHNDSFYIAMEYVDGWSLKEFSQHFAPVPIRVITFIMKEILAGLEFAHRANIIHRDIKPSNILIGKDCSVKIVDFGLARLINLPSITEQGGTVGTPAYMSPEQARSENTNAVSDIFSLGVTFYEFLTERSPFAGKNIVESIGSILNRHPEYPSVYRKNSPEWLDALIMMMIAKQPERRYQSCAAIQTHMNNIPHPEEWIGERDDLALLIIGSGASVEQVTDAYPSVVPVTPFKKGTRKWKIGIPVFFLMLILSIYAVLNLVKEDNTTVPHESQDFQDSVQVLSPVKDSLRSNPAVVNTDTIKQKVGQEALASKSSSPGVPQQQQQVREDAVQPIITTGKFHVVAIPWADIIIDGKKHDTTPMKEALTLEKGKHTLVLENPSYESHKQDIEIRSGVNDSLIVRLIPAMGYLMVQVVPWGELYLNGDYLDTTPLHEPAKLQRGRYTLLVKNPNFRHYAEDIEILPGITTTKTIYLQN